MYARPETLEAALDHMAEGGWTVLAGGTDFYPARVGKPLNDPILDITAISSLRGVQQTGNGWSIGALTTWTDIIRADLPPAFDGLKLAAREVGSIQIQNAGTVAGNLCNASPAADGVPPLLTLDAIVELASVEGTRRVALADFVHGNRKTDRRPGELVTAIHIPAHAGQGRSTFIKLGARKYLVISIVMVAARISDDDAALAVGSCSAVAQRLPDLEHDLKQGTGTLTEIAAAHLAPIAPIDDIRADAGYRRDAAAELVRRACRELGR